MSTKTDLAKEIIAKISPPYAKTKKLLFGKTEITEVMIETAEEAALIGKQKGRYVSVEADSIRFPFENFDEEVSAIASEIKKILPKKGNVLAVGIGNSSLSSDCLGPLSAKMLPCGVFPERELFSLVPEVEGKTGIEPVMLIKSAAKILDISAVILIDALRAEDFSNICRSIQLSDTGIEPGFGAGRAKSALDEKILGIPVVSIGTPTVVSFPGTDSLVSPAEDDILIKRAARLISCGIGLAVFPDAGVDFMKELIFSQ